MNFPNKLHITANKCVKKAGAFYYKHPIINLIILAHLLNLVIEILSRHSLIKALGFFISNVLIFEYSVLIILITLSLSLFFRKKTFFLSIFSFIWLALGITNCILLFFRITPLSATDFEILTSVWEIMDLYLSTWLIVLIVIAFVAVVFAFVVLAIRSKNHKRNFVQAAGLSSLSVLLLILSTITGTKTGLLPDQFENLPVAYRDYGFAYCFSISIFDRGIDEPEDYSSDKIEDILKTIDVKSPKNKTEKPNVIFVQLESFMDVNYIKGITPSQDPTPVFSHLKESCSSGFLTVPSVGAGTANTEFEVITGMSLDYFGTGEYPFKTILSQVTCETINYNLKELGYSCHAIHNHSGTFYSRNEVYANLGFDTFTSLEYMQDVRYNPIGWAKDYILTPEIMQTLKSTEGKDMIYAISVQAHGKYPSTVIDSNQKITVSGFDDEADQNAFEYYVNQLYETDAFIGNLLYELSNFDEKVVLVLFGDHLPNFDFDNTELKNGDVFQTEYVIWSNYGLGKETRDLNAYQLSAYVMNRLGFDNGVLTKLHQRYSDNPNYQQALELLEYDVLYGDQETYKGEDPYAPTKLHMGIYDISVDSAYFLGTTLYVTGKNFNEWSTICVDDSRLDTTYINENVLMAELKEPKHSAYIDVAQIGKDGVILSESSGYVYQPKTLNHNS